MYGSAGLFLALLGCDAPPAVFGEVLPDERLILREDELLPSGLTDDPAEWAVWLLEEAQGANRRHAELVVLLQAVAVLPANYRDRRDDSAVVWGPWIVDDVADRLWVEDRGSEQYGWAIERQTVDPDKVRFDDEAWIQGLSGTIDASAGDPAGAFVLDGDEVGLGVVDGALEALGGDTTDLPFSLDTGPIGRVGLRYALTARGGVLTTFADLAADEALPEAGGVTFEHDPGTGGTARATLSADRDGDGTPETIEVVAQWLASGGGRADVTSTEAGQVTDATECWGPDHARTFTSAGLGAPGDCLLDALP